MHRLTLRKTASRQIAVFSREGFRNAFVKHVESNGRPAVVIIIDDIAATGESLSANIIAFLDEFNDLLVDVKVRALTLVSTEAAQTKILAKIGKLEGTDIDFRSCEILPPQAFAFPSQPSVWRSAEEEARAKALCIDLGTRIYPRSPLGYGGLGLLVVFPTTVPNNSLPILHSQSRTSSHHRWEPLFPRITN